MTAPTDEFELAPAAAPAQAAAARAHRRRLRGHPATWVTVGLVLILAGAIAAPATPPVRPDLGAGVRWNIADLDVRTEPDPRWETTLETPEPLGVVEGTLFVSSGQQLSPESPTTFTALDLRTGEIGWTLADATDHCRVGSAGLVCVASPGTDDATIRTIQADGTETGTLAFPGARSAVDLDDGGYVLIDRERLSELVRIDSGGGEIWRTELSFSGGAEGNYTDLTVRGDVVSTLDGRYMLTTGEPADDGVLGIPETATDGTERQWLTDGSTRMVLPGGTEVAIPEGEASLQFDDALGGPVSIQESDAGWVIGPREDPSASWTLPLAEDCMLYGRVQGVLLQLCFAASGSETIAMDQLTGEQLWARSEAAGWISVASTDALLLNTEGGVLALDPGTGEQRWSVVVPGLWSTTGMVGDALLVWSDTTLLRLR